MKRRTANPPEPIEPPAHLSPGSQVLWRAIVPGRARSPGRLAMLLMALEARDRAEQAREGITKQGLYTTTKRTGMAHLSPLVKIERESRQLFVKIWTSLHLTWDHDLD